MNFATDAALRAAEDLDGRLDAVKEELAEALAEVERVRAEHHRDLDAFREAIDRAANERAELATAHNAAVARAEAAEREHEATKGMVRTLLAVEVEEPETTDDRWDQMKRRVRALVALASRIGGKP